MERLYNVFWKSENSENVVAIESSEECSHSSSVSRSTQSSTSSYSESLSYTSEDPSLVSHTSMPKCKTSKPIVHGLSNTSPHLITVKSNQSITTQKQKENLKRNKIYPEENVHSSKCSTSSSRVHKSVDSSFIKNAHAKEISNTNSAKKISINRTDDNNKSLKRFHSNSSRSFSSVEGEHDSKLGQINKTLRKFKEHYESKDNNSFVSDRQVNNSFSASLPAVTSPPHCAVYKQNSFHIPESDMSNFSINQYNKHQNLYVNNSNRHNSSVTSQSQSIDSMEEHEQCHNVKQHSACNLMQQWTNTQCATHKVHDKTVNILVIGTPQSGKSSFINTYRECVAFHGRWPAAPVGACGGAGTLTVEPFPDNVIRPSWLCIDTPGTIFNIFDKRKMEMLIRENMLVKKEETKEFASNLLNQSVIAAQHTHYSNSIVLDKLLAGMPWHIQLAGSNKMTDSEIVRLPTIRHNSAHHCIIVVAATELINDCGWLSWLLRKPRYAPLHSKVRLLQEDECYMKCSATENEEVKQLELEYCEKSYTEIQNELPSNHCKEQICESLPLSVATSVSRATSNEILSSSKHENHELYQRYNQRYNQREHNFKKALTSLAVPIAVDVCSSTEVNNHCEKEILPENELLKKINSLTRHIGNDVMFVEYLQYLILHIREKADDLIPHVVITKMDCVGGAGCVEARQAITKLLGKCISSNHIYFVANNTLTDNILPFDNWNNMSVDACTRHECLRLHQQLSLQLM